jgi:hypothetical protein
VPKEDVRRELSRDWFNVSDLVGKGALLDATGKCTDTIDNVITRKSDGLPEFHTGLNSLLAHPSALLNTLLLFGGCFVPVRAARTDDMETVRAMFHAATEYLDRMSDNRRCHNDTAALAELFTPLVPAMLAIIKQAGEQ